ncbi:hypothetical protein B0T18DRAFT_409926 [Schizothecium vesticola]|uniref:WD40 repeat-like protein n=1 Tax=Schizothecium vesticola TaxID=314040 RepID=A0AA40EUJ7_9PEZI|nr:hypothetical protein B0T18DRAFT_409926 [Schizothecium vesticola]
MRRFLGRGTADSSHDGAGVTSSPLSAQYRPSAAQNAVYDAHAPIHSLDRSPNGLYAVLASRHVLRTVSIDGLVIKDVNDYSIRDVKWGTGHGSSTIFTACAGGKIFQYDLARTGANATAGRGVDSIQIREDSRQVNTLDDGITRTGLTFRAIQAFKCNADGVRQVQWSPKDGFIFACATEQGVVLKWDIRKATAPLLRINAHDTCSAIAWHPDGEHLLSAGWDGKCHRQKPKWSIATPAPWSATAQGKRASQIAVSYDESSQKRFGINSVHIWDLARPTMPYLEIRRFDSPPSAILWHDQYLLWTAGHDGLFNQCDVTFAPKVMDRQAVSTMAFSSRGDIAMLLDERTTPQRPRPHVVSQDTTPTASFSSTPATPRFSVSRSDSEDDVIGTFLGPRRRGSQRRRPSMRSANTLSTTPPTGSGSATATDDIMSLDQTIKVTGIYRPQQSMALGHVPGTMQPGLYGYLAVNYLETINRELPYSPDGKAMPERIAFILEVFAGAAEKVSQFRLAQTWRILAYGVSLVLERRAQYHFEARMERLKAAVSKEKGDVQTVSLSQHLEASLDLPTDGDTTPRKAMAAGSYDQRTANPMSLIARELESTSNVATPLVGPVTETTDFADTYESGRGKKLTPIIEPESFTLPASIHAFDRRRRLDSEPLSVVSHGSETTQASVEGYDFYDTETFSRAIDVPSAAKRVVPPIARSQGVNSPDKGRRPFLREDSDDSLGQMFSVSDGRKTNTMTDSSNGSLSSQSAIDLGGSGSHRRTKTSDDGNFGSRIRGSHLDGSPGAVRGSYPLRRMLERTDTNYSAFTDEHQLITQTTSDSFESPYRSQTDAEFPLGSLQLASAAVDPDDDHRSPFIIESDYLCWPEDPPYPYPVQPSPKFSSNPSLPIQPYSLIARTLSFEVKSSALNASAIILLLKPLIPEDVIDSFQAAAILRQHHARLMSLKLFIEASLLRKLCMKGWPGGTLSSWGDDYPAITSPAHEGVNVGFSCSTCRKPREIDRRASSTESVWQCKRCKSFTAPCALCGHREVPPSIPTWWYCPGCGHGGHSSCMQAWHAGFEADDRHGADTLPDDPHPLESSEGYCPLDGCGHACLPSRGGRDDTVLSRSDEVHRAVRQATRGAAKLGGSLSASIDGLPQMVGGERGLDPETQGHQHGAGAGLSVRSDGNDIPQSRAVETVREALGSHPHPIIGSSRDRTGLGTGSILSSSPGRTGERVERERRKSVKFVAMPAEEI